VIGADAEKLFFFITNVEHGRFAYASSLSSSITNFIQGAITNSTVVFIHDNSYEAPVYKIIVSDGITNTTAINAVVEFKAYPILNAYSFAFGQGQLSAVTKDMLSATDAYSDPTKLSFFISDLQHGNFLLSTNLSHPISSFFQNQITKAQIKFQHDGSLTSPRFNISVSSGELTTMPIEALVKFDLAPSLQINNITIGQGATLTIKPTMLSASDPDVGDK
jgi:hypothetical protein